MEWLALVLDFLSTIAWPVVVLSIAFLSRKRLESLLDRTSNVSAAGMSAEFRFKEEIEGLSKSVRSSSDKDPKPKDDDALTTGGFLQHSKAVSVETPQIFLEEAREILEISPTAAAVLGRVALERALQDHQFASPDGLKPRSTSQALKQLRSDLGDELFEQSSTAIRIANSAAHGVSTGLTPPLAEELIGTIELLIKKLSDVGGSE